MQIMSEDPYPRNRFAGIWVGYVLKNVDNDQQRPETLASNLFILINFSHIILLHFL
jgi:hypothetical protein